MAEVKVAYATLTENTLGWRWRTYGANHQQIGGGESYVDERDADAALRAHLADPGTPVNRYPWVPQDG